MATDLRSPLPANAVQARRSRRRGTILLLIAAWNLWLWATRIYNLAEGADDFSAAFIGVHAVLYVVSIALAVVLAVMGWRLRREGRDLGSGS